MNKDEAVDILEDWVKSIDIMQSSLKDFITPPQTATELQLSEENRMKIKRYKETLIFAIDTLKRIEVGEMRDYLDQWGYRSGNMIKLTDDEWLKVATAIVNYLLPEGK
ncbi:hypothetical protein M0R04_12035 [Candidatus Dojkabacteria bacterium]|jgi:hypothetical protein|nr:hypothetical protein [Candidatus Dojkabacteria bacterium]